jgi:signal transduction histidine kinase
VIAELFRSRAVRLALALAIFVAIPVGILVWVQHRSLLDLEKTSAVVLETLSQQTADALQAALRKEFETPSYEMERVDHLAIEQFDLDKVQATLVARGPLCRVVDAFYVWSTLAPPGTGVLELPNAPGDGVPRAGLRAFRPAGEEADRLVALAQGIARHRLPWGMATETIEGRPNALVIHLLFDSSARQRLTSFIGFRVDLERLRHEELPRALEPMVRDASRLTGLATLAVEVVDAGGVPVYRSAGRPPARVLHERPLPLIFFAPDIMPARLACEGCYADWRLRIGYREGTLEQIARTSSAGQRTLLAALVLVLIVGVVLAARSAIQEVRLADAKSHFVASVSHDLKTPLALIQLFAETLDLGRVRSGDRAREYYAIIHREARKLAGLIDNVLDFSRIESGLRMYRVRRADLAEIVRRVVAGFGPQFEHERFEVALEVEPDVPPVMADPEAVELAVANLLSNAMKYSGEARRIEVAVARQGRSATVRVTDHGIGIPWRYHRKIFRKFYRVEGQGGDAPRGCGLGLAIVDHVMRAHRGRVVVESEPGRGSTFTLVFPALAEKKRDETDTGDRRRATDAAGAA